MDDKLLDINFGTTYQSDVITKVGIRADGETLPGFSVSNLSATLSDMDWSLTLYIDNMFDKYAFTGSRANLAYINQANFADKNFNRSEDLLRSYGHFVIKPRTIGLKFKYNFEL